MNDDTPAPPDEERHDDVRPEAERLPRGLIVRTALATVMVGTSLCFATYLIMRARVLAIRPSYDFPERALPAPHEVATVRQESFAVAHPRPDLREQQRAQLDSYGWVDRARGLVHIPIDEAIGLAARREAGAGRTGQWP